MKRKSLLGLHNSRRNEKIKFAKTGSHIFHSNSFFYLKVKLMLLLVLSREMIRNAHKSKEAIRSGLCCLDVQIRALTKI